MLDKVWYEKYRPTTTKNFIFPNTKIEDTVNKWIENNSLTGHILISGIQGTGKSTLARILAKELTEDIDNIKINASLDGGIDVIREKIVPFCKMAPMGNMKIVILEESDRLSIDTQKALRDILEEYDSTYFIFTCNYPSKIIPALHSRFSEEFEFDKPLNPDILLEYCIDILIEEGLKTEDDEVVDNAVFNLNLFIKKYNPDFRKLLNSIQSNFSGGVLNAPESHTEGREATQEWKAIWEHTPTLENTRELAYCIDNDNFEEFYRIMYDNVKNLPEDKIEQGIVLIALFLWRSFSVTDQEINLTSCLYRIFKDISE